MVTLGGDQKVGKAAGNLRRVGRRASLCCFVSGYSQSRKSEAVEWLRSRSIDLHVRFDIRETLRSVHREVNGGRVCQSTRLRIDHHGRSSAIRVPGAPEK